MIRIMSYFIEIRKGRGVFRVVFVYSESNTDECLAVAIFLLAIWPPFFALYKDIYINIDTGISQE